MSCNSLLSSSNADLARFYLMGEASGTTATDLSSAGDDGTYARDATNTTTTGPGKGFEVGQSFNGTSDQILSSATSLIDEDTTLVAWLNTADAGGGHIVSNHDATAGGLSLYMTSGGRLAGYIHSTAPSANSDVAVNDSSWHHCAVSYASSGRGLAYYVDGVAQGTATASGTWTTAKAYAVGGKEGSTATVDAISGSLAAAAVFSAVLSSTEVAQLAAGPEPIWLGTGTHHFGIARGIAYWNCPSSSWGLPTYLNAAATDNGSLTAEVRIVRDRGKATEATVATSTGFSGSVACAGSTDNLTLELRVSNDGGYDDSLGDDADGWVSVAWYGLEAKLEAAYLLDEQSGTTATDSSGNGNDGTYARDASNTYTAISGLGLIDGGQDFNGSSDEAIGPALGLTDADQTIACWLKKTTDDGGYLIACNDGVAGGLSLYVKSDGTLQGIVGVTSSTSSLASVDDGTWHHVAIIYDQSADTVAYYVDGVLDSAVAASGTWDSTKATTIGQRTGSTATASYHAGSIARAYIYSRALTSPEIAQLFAQGPTALVDVGRVAHYKLEETSGTTVADSSASGNDGTSTSNMSTLTAPGMVGRGANLDGTDYISAPWDGGFTYPTSVGCAFKLDTLTSAANRALVSLADASVFDVQWAFGAASTGTNMFVMRRNPGASNQTPVAPLTTNWHTAVVVFHDETSYSIYLDGTLLTVQTGLTSISASANVDTLLVGLQRLTSPSGYADGITFDEVSFWTRALSAAEAAEWDEAVRRMRPYYVFPVNQVV